MKSLSGTRTHCSTGVLYHFLVDYSVNQVDPHAAGSISIKGKIWNDGYDGIVATTCHLNRCELNAQAARIVASRVESIINSRREPH